MNAITISQDGSLIALTDNSNDHNIYFFNASSGNREWKEKGDTNRIFDLSFNTKSGGDVRCCSVGKNHIKFWNPSDKSVEKGIFGDASLATSFACCTYDSDGLCYAGATNSEIYVWEGRNLKTTVKNVHKGGFICAIKWMGGKIYSGGKDGNVVVTNSTSLEVERSFNFGCLIRAIDIEGSKALVGLRDGTIFHLDIESQAKKEIMESHSEGEVWGLAPIDDTHVITTGDDNKVKVWDIAARKCEKTGIVSNE